MRADCHLLRRLRPPSRPAVPLRTSTSTQEDGSRWAAQGAGASLVVRGLRESGERAPVTEHARREPFSGDLVAAPRSTQPRVAPRRAPALR
jgi:hypothetical protein